MNQKGNDVISVVISLFNKEEYIARAVNSVLKQTYQEFELIVVDDGSTDRSAEIVSQYQDPRIRLIRQVNGGESVARNRGITEAKNELIAFLDGDDAYNPEFLETIISLRKKYPDAGAYATAYEICYSSTFERLKFNGIPYRDWEGIIPNYFETALGPPPVWSSAVAIPKSTFEKTGNFFPEMKRGADLHMWLRVAFKYPIAFSSYVGARFFVTAAGRVTYQYRKILASEILTKTIDEALSDGSIEPRLKPYLAEYANHLLLTDAYALILEGDFQRARDLLNQCKTKILWRRKLWFRILASIPVSLAARMRGIKRKILK